MEKNRGAVRGKTGSKGKPVLDDRLTLEDLGVSKTQSSRWQNLASLSETREQTRLPGAEQLEKIALQASIQIGLPGGRD
jgi:hypothetical protein